MPPVPSPGFLVAHRAEVAVVAEAGPWAIRPPNWTDLGDRFTAWWSMAGIP
ncbi:MAG TPA: hypothetical protein VGC11_17270 [Acidimicrobiia bacterium]